MEDRTCYVYKLQNKHNGKCYIGRTVNIKDRMTQHRTCKDSAVYEAIQKHGFDAFDLSFMEVPIRDAKWWEEFMIQYFDSFYNGYNKIANAGSGGPVGSEPLKHKSVRLPVSVVDRIEDYAMENGTTFTEALIALVMR